MASDKQYHEEPCFVISVAARMVGLHAQTLRYYERVGLVWPSRSDGNQRLFSPADIERLRRIKTLTEDLGVNLAGAEVALKLMARIEELEAEVQQLTDEMNSIRNLLANSSRRQSNSAANGVINGHPEPGSRHSNGQ